MEYLIEAIKIDNAVQVKELLQSGIDPNGFEDYAEVTPLHFAAQNNALQSAKLLLEAGADSEIETIDDITPIQVASMHSHENMVALLLDHSDFSL